MVIKCLLSSIAQTNIQGAIGRCDKIFNTYSTKTGKIIKEVISDYGNSVLVKSEIHPNKIIQQSSNGDIITYTRNHLGDVFVNEGNNQKISKNTKLWDNLLSVIFKGL